MKKPAKRKPRKKTRELCLNPRGGGGRQCYLVKGHTGNCIFQCGRPDEYDFLPFGRDENWAEG